MVLRPLAWMEAAAALVAAWICAQLAAIASAVALFPAPAARSPRAPNAVTKSGIPLDAQRLSLLFALTSSRPPDVVTATVRGQLIATAVAEPSRYSLCQIVSGTDTRVLGVGEKVDGVRVAAIEPRRVRFENGAELEMSAGSPSITTLLLHRDELNAALAHLPELMTQARAMPSFTNGVLDGFRLSAIVPGSLYARVGLQNGDVIHRINGTSVTSAEAGLQLFEKLRNASRIEVELERQGQGVRTTYSIQ